MMGQQAKQESQRSGEAVHCLQQVKPVDTWLAECSHTATKCIAMYVQATGSSKQNIIRKWFKVACLLSL